MKKTLLAIALAIATLPVMSFAQAPPASSTPATKTKTKKHANKKMKHAKKASKTAAK